jgi:hypothetical protein
MTSLRHSPFAAEFDRGVSNSSATTLGGLSVSDLKSIGVGESSGYDALRRELRRRHGGIKPIGYRGS